MEAIYPNNIAYAETLVEHWEQAGISTKALVYLVQAVDHFIRLANYTNAEALIERGLCYGDRHKATLLRVTGEAKRFQDDYEGAIVYYTASLQLNTSELTEHTAS